LADIKPRDIIGELKPLPPSEKQHAFACGRAFFRWCIHEHLLDRSPMENLEAPANGKSRERSLSADELACLWQATECPRTAFRAIVRLLILTGQRRGEIARLEWSWINEAEKTITIPSSITKNKRTHTFPYGDIAAHVFAAIPRLEGCPYVFPASRARSEQTTVFKGWGKPKAALDRDCGVTGWTLHDLRRTFSSNMAALGVAQIVVEKLLNHISGGTQSPIAQTYNRYAYLEEMREAVGKWERYLSELVSHVTAPC
jgi:integrase